jgi:hypothetical protein
MNAERYAIPGEECDCGPWVVINPGIGATAHRQPHQFVHLPSPGAWRCRFCLRWAGTRNEAQP